MSAIRQSLSNLNRAIAQLEGAMDFHEKSLKGKQRDMFASAPLPKPSNNNSFNPEDVAQRLDGAIARIESVLKEGRA